MSTHAEAKPRPAASGIQEMAFLVASSALIYFYARFLLLWLAGWYYGWIFRLYADPAQVSRFQFVFGHIFEFSFFPPILFGLLGTKYRYRAAQFVWIIPTAILAWKVWALGDPASVLSHHDSSGAFHHYFARDFLIPEWHSYSDLFALAGSNPDMNRGMDQLQFTAPFYAAVGYSLAALICLHTDLRGAIRREFRRMFSSEEPAVERTLGS